MKRAQIAILSIADDLHALVIRKALEDRYDAACCVIETERICGGSGVNWSNVASFPPMLQTMTGDCLDVRTLDLVWWRRVSTPQEVPSDVTDPAHMDFITNDCREAVLGLLLNEFRGVWVSDPQATRLAGNKLVQLRAAQRAGFRTPRTLVSQNPQQIRRFCEALHGRVVVKAVKGTMSAPSLTAMVNETMLRHEDSLRLCPAIYQEFIAGARHVRAHCFGDAIHAALIESEDLDWRRDLNVPVRPYDLPENVEARLRKVLKALGLKMGIVDLKLDERGEAVWLEVNPQGQFLFIEGLCGLPLIDAFCTFLCSEAKASPRMRSQRAQRGCAAPVL